MSTNSTPIDRNKTPILICISKHLVSTDIVLEIGSGSCEHIKYFSEALSEVQWQPSDLSDCHINQHSNKNILSGIQLDMLNMIIIL